MFNTDGYPLFGQMDLMLDTGNIDIDVINAIRGNS